LWRDNHIESTTIYTNNSLHSEHEIKYNGGGLVDYEDTEEMKLNQKEKRDNTQLQSTRGAGAIQLFFQMQRRDKNS